jgi:hypothetical protein
LEISKTLLMAQKWVDVFVTKGEDYSFDDTFCCTVQSIEFTPSGSAYITENSSEWILPTWTFEYQGPKRSAYNDIKVGDLVRIGGKHTEGFTDYLTVLEIKHIGGVSNGTSSACSLAKGLNPTTLPAPTTTSNGGDAATGSTGFAHIALRLNASLNCTVLPRYTVRSDATAIYHRQQAYIAAGQTDATKFATLEHRHLAYEYMSNPQKAYSSETIPSEGFYYPLYKANNWTEDANLKVQLDHGVKSVDAVKLLGYSLVNKRAVGLHHSHEMLQDDYLILRIKELDSKSQAVISNNEYAQGAFAVLRVGDSSHTSNGGTEYSVYEPQGLVCHTVPANSNMRTLTIQAYDRLGNPAHFGRFHLWLKLQVTHG